VTSVSHRLKDSFGLAFLSITSEQQKCAGQSLLRRVKQLIHEVRLNSDVPRKHVRDETVGQFVLGVKHAHHFTFFNHEHGCR
jgi:hypothetical protein